VSADHQPYVGPRPFEKADKAIFFGRDRETEELSAMIAAHPVVLLYAQSGAGKTSLLNAALIPMLEQEGIEVLPPARVSGAEADGVETTDIKNIYAYNALTRWIAEDVDPAWLSRLSIPEFLASQQHKTDEDGLLVLRVVIFDQFEELFTSYTELSGHRKAFFDQVRIALEGEPTPRKKSGQTTDDLMRMKGDPLLRVVFVVREDYLAQMDSYAAQLPEKLRTRFRLERLRQEAALSAVTGPLKMTNSKRSFAPGVAERLVTDLMKIKVLTVGGKTEAVKGEFVEPVQLQVVCQRLMEALPEDVTVVTEEHLQDFGDVGHALSVFYEECLARAVAKTGVKERELRTWFDRTLITSAETRGTVYRGAQDTGGIRNEAVDALENQHIIRGEWRAGAKWYELTHDRLIEPIKESNRKWLAGRWETEQILQRIEAKVAEWVRLGRGRGGLLDEVELLEVDRWMSSIAPDDISSMSDLRTLVENSRVVNEAAKRERQAQRELELAQAYADEQKQRAEHQEKAARYFRLFAITLSVLLLIVIGGGVFIWLAYDTLEQVRISQLLAAQSASALSDQKPDLALLLGVEAYRTSDTFEAKDGLLTALVASSNIIAPLRGHKKPVNSVAFSPDGKMLASGGYDDKIILWNTDTGEEAHPLRSHTESVRSVAFSPDGKMLASGGDDSRVIIWDTERCEPIRHLEGHTQDVNCVAFGLNGKVLASASFDKTIIIWDTATGQPLHTLDGHSDAVSSIAFDASGQVLASASYDKSIIRWDVATGERIGSPLTGSSIALSVVAMSSDGTRLAWDGGGGSIVLWDVTTGQRSTLTEHELSVRGLAFNQGGTKLASSSEDGTIILRSVQTGQPLGPPLKHHGGPVNSVAFSPNGNVLASASEDGSVILWDVSTGQQLGKTLINQESAITDLTFSPNRKTIAWASVDKAIRLRDVAGGSEETVANNPTSVYSIAFSPDNTKLAWGLNDGAVLRDLVNGKPDITIVEEGVRATGIDFSPDGSIFAMPGKGNTVNLRRADTGNLHGTLPGHSDRISWLAFSPDGKVLASAGMDKKLMIWNVDTRQPIAGPLDCYEQARLAFSPNGEILAYSGPANDIVLFDVATGQTKAFSGHEQLVTCIAFSPDGRMLASGSWDKTVILWNVVPDRKRFTLQMIGSPLKGHKDTVTSLAFNFEGNKLASASKEGSIILWDVDIQSWLNLACKIANRNLTDEEWRQYFGDGAKRRCFPDKP
jgi:WD40 repeat protein